MGFSQNYQNPTAALFPPGCLSSWSYNKDPNLYHILPLQFKYYIIKHAVSLTHDASKSTAVLVDALMVVTNLKHCSTEFVLAYSKIPLGQIVYTYPMLTVIFLMSKLFCINILYYLQSYYTSKPWMSSYSHEQACFITPTNIAKSYHIKLFRLY